VAGEGGLEPPTYQVSYFLMFYLELLTPFKKMGWSLHDHLKKPPALLRGLGTNFTRFI